MSVGGSQRIQAAPQSQTIAAGGDLGLGRSGTVAPRQVQQSQTVGSAGDVRNIPLLENQSTILVQASLSRSNSIMEMFASTPALARIMIRQILDDEDPLNSRMLRGLTRQDKVRVLRAALENATDAQRAKINELISLVANA